MEDDQILKTIESMLGKNIQIVDCEHTETVRNEEIILINGIRVDLNGKDGDEIKKALVTGQVPSCDLINQLLFNAGIIKKSVRLETTLNVKSTTVSNEEVTIKKDGKLLDEKSSETKEDNFYTSSCTEIWEPIKIIPTNHKNIPKIKRRDSAISTNSINSSPSSSYSSSSVNLYDNVKPSTKNYLNLKAKCNEKRPINKNNNNQSISCDSGHEEVSNCNFINTPDSMSSCCGDLSSDETDFISVSSPIYLKGYPQQVTPTIFGTVASFQYSKDAVGNKRGLPQTGQGSKSSSIRSVTDIENSPSDQHIKDDLDDQSLVYRDGNLISGSLEALIQHMVPTCDYYPDRSYLFAFLLSSRLFIKPHELLDHICQLCCHQQQLNSGNSIQTENHKKFANHFIQLLTEWIETFPYDFRDERFMVHVRSITQKCILIEMNLRKEVSSLLQNLLQRLTSLDNYEEFLKKINFGGDFHNLTTTSSTATTTSTSSSSSSSNHQQDTDITELCPSTNHLAHQLTHIELERLFHIGPEEFVQAFAKENPHLKTTFKDMKKTRNLESYVQWFNRLSYLVATEIVKHSKKKQRVKVVEYWIETARECFNIGNFNSLMAIIAGLNMSPISRLKKTWAKVQSAKFSILEHQMDPTSNFNSYRSTLKAAMWRSAGATDERQRIVIPFFSLLVKDLYFLNEGCSNKLPNGHINFEKFWQLAKQVTEFIAWKQVTCPFDKNMKVIMFLQTNQVLTENSLAMASFECETPDSNSERDRYKMLKAEQNI